MDETTGDTGAETTAGDPDGSSTGLSTSTTDTGSTSASTTDTGPSATDGTTTELETGASSSSTSDATGTATDTGDPGVWCTDDYDPVCGEDGKTYDHPCSAIAAGVGIKRKGPCFGDCAGSCSVGGSPLTLTMAIVAALVLRTRRR